MIFAFYNIIISKKFNFKTMHNEHYESRLELIQRDNEEKARKEEEKQRIKEEKRARKEEERARKEEEKQRRREEEREMTRNLAQGFTMSVPYR